MEFKKERNFIVGYEDDKAVGKWDILTGQFYGKTDKPVKSVPRCFSYNYINEADNNPYGLAVYIFRDNFGNNSYLTYTPAVAQRLEVLVSLGLHIESVNEITCHSIPKMTKDVVDYLKENYGGCYRHEIVRRYKVEKEYNITDKPDWWRMIFTSLSSKYPVQYLTSILNRIEHEHVRYFWKNPDYQITTIIEMVKHYYNYCMDLYGSVKVTANILSNFTQIAYLHEQWKNEHYAEVLKKNNDKPFLYFENGNYKAFPLLTREDFHQEAESQHNCVERCYLDDVFENQTYIVVIRNINNPDKSCITCEVSHDGSIRQYLTFANGRVTDQEQIEFKYLYQTHIMENMGE